MDIVDAYETLMGAGLLGAGLVGGRKGRNWVFLIIII